MNRARLEIGRKTLLALLHLPPDTSVIGANVDLEWDMVSLVIEHPDLKDKPDYVLMHGVKPKLALRSGLIMFDGWGQ